MSDLNNSLSDLTPQRAPFPLFVFPFSLHEAL
jgi:hypothetical protein